MNIIFLLTWLLAPIIWYFMLRASDLSIFKISIPSVLIAFIILYQYLGIPILYFQLDEYRASEVTDHFLMIKVFLFMSLGITSLIFGFILGRKIFGPIHSFKLVYLENSKEKILIFLNCFLFFICLFVLYSYINKIGFNNLVLTSLFGLVSDVSDSSNDLLRSNMTNSFDGKYHWYHLFMVEILFLSTMIFFVMSLQKKGFIRKSLSILSMLTISFALLMSGQKAPITELLFGIGMVLIILNSNSIIHPKVIFIAAITLFITVVPLFYFFTDSSNILEAITSVISRTLTGQLQPVYVYLEYFPSNRDFLLGATMPNPGGLMPFEPINITQEIMAWYNPQEAQGVVGSMPTIFWVEAYINFGILGLIFLPMLIGLFIYGVNILILMAQNNSITLASYVWLILFYKDLSSSFFSDFIISIYLFFTMLIFLLFSLIIGFGKFQLKARNIKT